MAAPLLNIKDLSLSLADRPLLRALSFPIADGDRLVLVGRNGCGKSTLLKIIAGVIEADQGEITAQTGVRVAYLPQEPVIAPGTTALQHVIGGLREEEQVSNRHRAEAALDLVGMPEDALVERLSGGEARRVDLARVFAADAQILLLDEPTNHLDLPGIAWLENRLARHNGALMVISHDRRFLETIGTATLWLDRTALRRMDKGFAHFDDWADQVLTEEATQRRKMERTIQEETRWSREGISARRKRNQGRLKRLHDMRSERAEQMKLARLGKLSIESGDLSGKIVIEATGIQKAYGERQIIQPFNTIIQRGDRVGLIGPNGAGKSTLLKMLTGRLKPDSGKVRLGANLTPAWFDQHREQLDLRLTVQEVLCPDGSDHLEVKGRPRHVSGYLREFLFDPKAARSPVAALSGGERNRLLLAKTLAQPANLLILDEPTNDLDMDTLDLLQDALESFPGTVLVVSHDRDFLDRVVTSTMAIEPDGTVVEYAGGYSDVQTQSRPKPKGVGAAKPPKAAPSGPNGREERSTTDPEPKRKLSFKEQQALKTLPKLIDALQREISTLETALNDPALYTKDPGGATDMATRLEAARTALETKELEWLELEVLRESLER